MTHATISHAIEQADQLRQQAISLLLSERSLIDDRLALLGYNGTAPQTTQKSCRICGDTSHNVRTCPRKAASPDSVLTA